MAHDIIDARVRLPFGMFPDDTGRPQGLLDRYEDVLSAGTRNAGQDESTMLKDLDVAGIDRAIVHAEYEFGDPADALNRSVADLVDRRPDRLSGFGTISLLDLQPSRAYAQVAQVADLGLLGINIQPGFFGLTIDHRGLYPAYAHCEELGLVVAVHTGINYARTRPISTETPLMVDQIAADFPSLQIIACHAAWPWTTELAAVARRHPTVSFDFGAVAPKYVARSGTGWDVLFGWMQNHLSGQAMFASDWPTFPIDRGVREWDAIDLKPEVRHALMGGNAARLIERGRNALTSSIRSNA